MGGGAKTTGPFEVTRVESAAESSTSGLAASIELAPQASLLGRYSLLRKLGEGGMGVVYSAFDEELDRRVAIKLLRTREGGERGASRMLREAQAMARLSHPNVVQVYDVGLLGGQLFVAMEYVQGQSLREWAGLGDGARALRPWREVVAMYMQAGAGLSAAHAGGIVHRDFKPDNVLVGVDGRARVVDFGLAARAEAAGGTDDAGRSARARVPVDLTESLRGESVRLRSYDIEQTAAGTLIGTPAYMSPEQHLRQATDARSDQFSFCVSLHEALYGERPFAGQTLGELTRAVLEGRVREPPPGRKVPGWLRRAVLRGLSIAPEERHADMSALLAALAADPARARARWFAGIGATALVSATLVAAQPQPETETPVCQGADARISQVWGPERARAVEAALLATGRTHAPETWSKVHDFISMYVETWRRSYVDACEATWVRGEQSDELLDLRMACLGDGLAELDALLTVLAEADEAVAERAVRAAADLRPSRRCDDARALRAPGAPPPASAEAVQKVMSELAQLRAMAAAGLYERGRARAVEAVAAAEATGHAPAVVEALLARGRFEEQLVEYESALRTLVDAYARAEAAGHAAAKAEIATLLLKITGERLARDEVAALWARLAEAVLEQLGWPVEARIEYLAVLGAVHTKLGRQAEALAALDEVLALETGLPVVRPNRAVFHRFRGNALLRLGRVKEAQAEYERSIALAGQSFGAEHPEVARSTGNLGEVLRLGGELDAAEANFGRAAAITERAFGADHPAMIPYLSGLATIAYGRGDLDAAAREFRRVAAVFERAPGPDLAIVVANIGEVELKQGKVEEAQATLERALALFREGLGIDHPLVFDVRANLAEVLVARGRPDEAAAEYDAAIAAIERAHGADHPDLVKPLAGRARLALARRKPAAAVPLFERALAVRSKSGAEPRDTAELRQALADALWDSRIDRARARVLVDEARQALATAGDDERSRAAEAWLSSHSAR